jgi:ribA/ribD-fused uncharacterized protein
MEAITRFENQNGWLSNFEAAVVIFDQVLYKTVEHAYQASKFLDPEPRELIRSQRYPGQAKKKARELTNAGHLRPDWEEVNMDIMWDLQNQKYTHPHLRRKLLATGTVQLVEGNYWHDQFWGNCTCNRRPICAPKGENRLGVMVMTVRANLAGAEI